MADVIGVTVNGVIRDHEACVETKITVRVGIIDIGLECRVINTGRWINVYFSLIRCVSIRELNFCRGKQKRAN